MQWQSNGGNKMGKQDFLWFIIIMQLLVAFGTNRMIANGKTDFAFFDFLQILIIVLLAMFIIREIIEKF